MRDLRVMGTEALTAMREGEAEKQVGGRERGGGGKRALLVVIIMPIIISVFPFIITDTQGKTHRAVTL